MMYNFEMLSQIENFNKELNNIKESLKKLSEKLQYIVYEAQQNNYIEQRLLIEGIEVIQIHSTLQEDFFSKMQTTFPDLTEKSLQLAEKILENTKKEMENLKFAYESLEQFLYVDIKQDVENRENIIPLLNACKEKVKKIMMETSRDGILAASEPYRIFVENVKDYRIKDAEAEIIESEFPGPIYRMLYREQLFISSQQETYIIEQAITENRQKMTDIFSSETVDNANMNDKTSNYIFKTEKEDKPFGVKAFLSDMKSKNGSIKMRILYLLGLYRILSKKQLLCYAVASEDSEDAIDTAINSLIREGYLTEIINIENPDKYYCLSEKSSQMFRRKDSIEEFRRRKLTIPKVITSSKVFKENEKLICQLTFLNGLILMITEKEISDISQNINEKIKYTLINCAISNCEVLYYELTVENELSDKIKFTILSGITNNDAEKLQINDVIAKNNYDTILYIPYNENNEEIWNKLNSQPFNNVSNYILQLDNCGEKKKLVFCDNEGNNYTITDLLEKILIDDTCIDDFYDLFEIEDPLVSVKNDDGELDKSCDLPEKNKFQENDQTEITVTSNEIYYILPEGVINLQTGQNTENSGKPSLLDIPTEDNTGKVFSVASSVEMANEFFKVYKGKIDPNNIMLIICQLILENLIMEAVVFAKTLSFIPDMPQFKTLYNRLLMATNMSLDSHKYTGNSLVALDQEEAVSTLISTDALKILRLSSFAWALCIPDMQRDYILYNYKDSIMSDINEQLSQISPSSKQIFSLLFNLSDYSPTGFSSPVLSLSNSENNRKETQEKLSAQARNLLEVPRKHMQTYLRGFPELLQICFGKKSDLYMCMDIVCCNRINERSFVQSTFEVFADSFSNEGEVVLSYTDRKINEYIDECWDKVHERKADKLIEYSPARNIMVSNIKKRLDIMKVWLQLTCNVTATVSENLEHLTRIRNLLIVYLESACRELAESKISHDISVQAGFYVIRNTFSKLLNYLRDGTPYQNKWDYINLLSSYQINLNDELKPNLNPNLQDIEGFEPWRRMMQHIASPKVSFKDALEKIDNPGEINWYSNYTTAEHIILYLQETEGIKQIEGLSESRYAARQEVIQHAADFKSKLELAYAYGNIEESTKESILQIVSIFNDYFEHNGDFAHYRAFLNVLEKRIDEESQQHEKSLIQRKQKTIEERNLTAENAPILKMIEASMKDKNFAVTEEYLNRLEYGELEIPDEELKVENEYDYHGDFLKMYEELYSLCLRYKGDTPVNWGYRSIEGRLNKSWQAGQRRSSEELLKSWPKRKGSPDNSNAIRSFLSHLDFKVENIFKDPNEKVGDKYNLFNVYMTPTEKNLRDYSHPIARFGTLISNPIHVVCLFGANSANELINTITNKLHLGGNTIVLMDGALSHEERKKVAEKFKSDTSAQNFFLLIDRVLLLFISTLDRGERLSAMLKCTLPYTYYQPFVHGGGSINDEMFFGRKSELNSILNPNGACFVYGGRQLGKTALLKRACSIAHKPEEKRYALYINIFEKKKDTFIKELCEEMRSDRLKLIKKIHTTFEDICKELSDEFDKGNIVQLQLFIDEADEFLEEIKPEKYSTLTPFVNLKSRTNNRFKFVLAGLHNVARLNSAMDRNSIFQQLGMPLCIKPLSPSDARKLVERPLSYLGFKLERTQLSLILAYTNYYPGIIHFFCYTLVESIAENYRSYYSAAGGNPPYYLTDEQLRRVFVSGDLNNQIKDKLDMTLKLDIRYKIIANIFAHLYYENKKQGISRLGGYTVEQVRGVIDIQCLKILSDDEFELLLVEMVNMGILWSKPDSHMYRLRKNNFPEMIGSEDKVEDVLLAAASEVL